MKYNIKIKAEISINQEIEADTRDEALKIVTNDLDAGNIDFNSGNFDNIVIRAENKNLIPVKYPLKVVRYGSVTTIQMASAKYKGSWISGIISVNNTDIEMRDSFGSKIGPGEYFLAAYSKSCTNVFIETARWAVDTDHLRDTSMLHRISQPMAIAEYDADNNVGVNDND